MTRFISCLVPLLLCAYLRTSLCSSNVLELFPEFEQLSRKVENGFQNVQSNYNKLQTSVGSLQSSVNALKRSVAFSAYYSEYAAGRTGDIKEGYTFIFDRVTLNRGGAYSTSSGKFVAPYSGTYAFTWTLCADARKWDGGYGEFDSELVVGSSVYGKLQVDTETKTDDACSTAFVAVEVQAGQNVYLRNIYDHQGRLLSKEDQTRTTFSGWFMF